MRRFWRALAGVAYVAGGIELGVGAVLALTPDPAWNPRLMILAGVWFLLGGKSIDWIAPPAKRGRS
jgi:hypothetical protein